MPMASVQPRSSLIGNARLNRVDPKAYLSYIITHINAHQINKIAEVLLWNVVTKFPSLTQDTTEFFALAA